MFPNALLTPCIAKAGSAEAVWFPVPWAAGKAVSSQGAPEQSRRFRPSIGSMLG
jgi:hypothetical protein